MRKLKGPILGLHLTRHNSIVIDTTHGFTFPTLQRKSEALAAKKSAKPQRILSDDNLTIPPMTTKTMIAFVDHPSEWKTTGRVTLLERFIETANLLLFHSKSTRIDKKVAVRLTNTTESPYTITKNTQTAQFYVVTPEHS